MERWQVGEDVDAAAPIQVSGLQQPQIVPVEVAQRAVVLRERPPLKVE